MRNFRIDERRTLTFNAKTAYYINGQSLIDTMRQGGYDNLSVTQDRDGAVVVTFGWHCEHNAMRERVGDPLYAWECADCGRVYGEHVAGPEAFCVRAAR